MTRSRGSLVHLRVSFVEIAMKVLAMSAFSIRDELQAEALGQRDSKRRSSVPATFDAAGTSSFLGTRTISPDSTRARDHDLCPPRFFTSW